MALARLLLYIFFHCFNYRSSVIAGGCNQPDISATLPYRSWQEIVREHGVRAQLWWKLRFWVTYRESGTGKVVNGGFHGPWMFMTKSAEWSFSQSQRKGSPIAKEVGERPKSTLSFSSDKCPGRTYLENRETFLIQVFIRVQRIFIII